MEELVKSIMKHLPVCFAPILYHKKELCGKLTHFWPSLTTYYPGMLTEKQNSPGHLELRGRISRFLKVFGVTLKDSQFTTAS